MKFGDLPVQSFARVRIAENEDFSGDNRKKGLIKEFDNLDENKAKRHKTLKHLTRGIFSISETIMAYPSFNVMARRTELPHQFWK
jgi:hypothetical protein